LLFVCLLWGRAGVGGGCMVVMLSIFGGDLFFVMGLLVRNIL
jgi:hypothetical protein